MKLPHRQFIIHFIKYSFVGFGNLLFTLAVYFLFLKILDFHYLVAYTISWVSGLLFTYVINFLWVFKPEQKLQFKERLFKFCVVFLISFLVNFFLLKWLTQASGKDPLLAQIFILPLIVAINFTGVKYWAMRKAGDGSYEIPAQEPGTNSEAALTDGH